MHIAEAAFAAASHNYALTALGNIGNKKSGSLIIHLRPKRNIHDEILAALAEHLLPLARASILSDALWLVIERKKRIDVLGSAKYNISSAPAITAVRTAKLDECLAPKRHRAVAPLTGANENYYLIYKCLGFHLMLLYQNIHLRYESILSTNSDWGAIFPNFSKLHCVGCF